MDGNHLDSPLPRRPWLRRDVPLLWRGETRLQIGTDPQRLIIIDTTRSLINWAATLRGERTLADALEAVPGSLHRVETSCSNDDEFDVLKQQRLRLLQLLNRGGAVADAADMNYFRGSFTPEQREQLDRQAAALRHCYTDERATHALLQRRQTTVAVHGDNQLSELICQLLFRAGVAAIVKREPPSSTSREGRSRSRGIDLYILAHSWHPDLLDDAGALASDIPHLYVATWGRTAAIGPLVIPGMSSCLHCAHLHKRDADPLWPRLLVQLTHLRPDVEAIDTCLLHLAAAHATMTATGFIDAQGDPSRYATLLNRQRVIYAPEGESVEAPMPTHPLCGCRWQEADVGA
jgi:hypothetical protein